jgi:hypothetical protein
MSQTIIELDKQTKQEFSKIPKGLELSERLFFNPSLEILLRNKQENNSVQCGYGRCGQCGCKAFQGSQDMCENCGHNFGAHW